MERSVPEVLDLRLPRSHWLGGYVAALFMMPVGLGLAVGAVVAAQRMGWQLGAFLGLTSGVCLSLAIHTLRDARAKHGLSMRADANGVELRLPAARSLVRSLRTQNARVSWAEIAALETRLEAYRSLGMANMQRAYVLRLRSGVSIFLGEDRALGTKLATGALEQLIARLRERRPIELTDLGMAEGRGGLLGVLFTKPPAWSDQSLDARRQAGLWQAAMRPALLVLLVPLLVLAAALLSR